MDTCCELFQEPVDGVVQVYYGLLIPLFDGLHNAVADMVFQDQVAGVVDGGPDGGQLDQDLAAVCIVFDHPFDRLNMPGGFGKAIDDGFLLRLAVNVFMVTMVVVMTVFMAVVKVFFLIVFCGVCHCRTRFEWFDQPGCY